MPASFYGFRAFFRLKFTPVLFFYPAGPFLSIMAHNPLHRTLGGLDWLNFFLADVQAGVGPFIAIYLAGYHWDEQQVGLVLMAGSLAGIVTQAPAGWLVDTI